MGVLEWHTGAGRVAVGSTVAAAVSEAPGHMAIIMARRAHQGLMPA